PMVEVAFRWSFDLDNQIVQQKSPPPQPLTSKSACTPLSTIALLHRRSDDLSLSVWNHQAQ
ncbi:MAG: hypothetical protein WBX11_15155, partial [Thiobacillaceae bacterium]